MKLRQAGLWIMLILLIISVPWYRSIQDTTVHLSPFGLPDWVTVAFGCYLLIALINTLLWITAKEDEEDE